jgi:cellulose biosynthesis protein BcsQ
MRVVAVYSMKGGVGKTTTAVNLAHLSARSGARTLLWDLDAQAAATFAFRVRPKVAGFGPKSVERGRGLLEAIKSTDYDNLDLLPADFAYRRLDRYLERLEHPEQGLVDLLQRVGEGYAHVFLDCPAGFSALTRGVLAAADAVLVPTIPTVLSLRTLWRLLERIARHGGTPRLFALLSMVDRRKALHRKVCEWAAERDDLFLRAEIPYASVVEQLSVRRTPLAFAAPQDPAARAFEAASNELMARLRAVGAAAAVNSARHARLIAEVGALIAVLAVDGGETSAGAPPDSLGVAPNPQAATAPPPPPAPEGASVPRARFRLRLHGEEEFHVLARILEGEPARSTTTRLTHVFDTDMRDLDRRGSVVTLEEEQDRFVVAAQDRPARRDVGGTSAAAPRCVAQIDGRWAGDVLSGRLSPLAVLERRLGRPLPPLIPALSAAIGDRSLRRVAWCQRTGRLLGPVVYPRDTGEPGRLTLQLETSRFSGGAVEHEVVISADGLAPHDCEVALRNIFSRAGVDWRPLPDNTVPRVAAEGTAAIRA